MTSTVIQLSAKHDSNYNIFFSSHPTSSSRLAGAPTDATNVQGSGTTTTNSGLRVVVDQDTPSKNCAIGQTIETPRVLVVPLSEQKMQCPIDWSDGTRIGLFTYIIDTDVSIWSPELAAIYGVATGPSGPTTDHTAGLMVENEAPRNWSRLIHPDDVAETTSALKIAFETGIYESQFRVVTPTGEIKLIRGCGRVVYDANGKPQILTGINADITPKVQSSSS